MLAAVQEFLTAIEHRLQYDSETIVFASDVKVHVLDKSLVVDRAKRDGAYMTARAVFDPVHTEQGRYSGFSRGGTLKIILNLAGEYIDDVYSRANVVDE